MTGEDPATAALRELTEETGIRSATILGEAPGWLRYDLPPHLIGKAWNGKYRGQEQKWYAVRFPGPDSEIDIDAGPTRTAASSSILGSGWRRRELDELIVPFKRDVYRQVVAAFAPHATFLRHKRS